MMSLYMPSLEPNDGRFLGGGSLGRGGVKMWIVTLWGTLHRDCSMADALAQ